MLGAIIGDISGSRFEFNNTKRKDFELFTRECSFTDDTICTIAVADAILKGIPYRDSLLYWCRKYPHPMGGYGGSFARWVAAKNPQPYDSFGNGSAMRVAPIAWAFNSLEEVTMQAEQTAIVSHNHPEGVKGAVAVAHAIFAIRNGSLQELPRVGNIYYPNFREMPFPKGKFDETCMGTVPLAFQLVLQSASFEDAIRNAIAWGGDSDTIATIVGAISEAAWDIPAHMREAAFGFLPTEMLDVIRNFYCLLSQKHE